MKALLKIYKRAYSKKLYIASILAIVFLIVDVMIALFIPFLAKPLFDEAIPNQDLIQVYTIGAIVVGIALLAVLSTIFNNIAAQYISTIITADIREDLFRKIQTLSLANLDHITTGKLLTIVTNDTLQIQQIIMMSFRIVIRAPLTLIGAIIMAYLTNADLFIVILVFVPILAISFGFLIIKAAPRFRLMQQRVDDLNTKLEETISGAREIKSFVTEIYEQQKFETVNEKYNKSLIHAAKLISLISPIIIVISNIIIISVVFLAAYLIDQGDTTLVGSVVTYIAYVQQIILSLMMLSMVAVMLSRALVSAERMNSVLIVEVDIKNQDAPLILDIKGEIEFEDVSFTYLDDESKGSAEVGSTLNNINLHIQAGETIGVIGSTGSGKTTLVQLIPRLYDVTKGKLRIDGVDIREHDLMRLREQISFVTQEAIIFQGTIAENIRQGKNDASHEELENAAELALAKEFIDSTSNQFETIINQAGTNLSGGQRQRLSLTRALIRKPKILILDDATSAVDANTEAQIKDNLKSISDTTIIIVAQKISSIIHCDKIIVLSNNGEIDGIGPHEDILKTSKVYQEIYQSQFGGRL